MTRLPKVLAALFATVAAVLVAVGTVAFVTAPRPAGGPAAVPTASSSASTASAGPSSIDIVKVYRTGLTTAAILVEYRCTGSSDDAMLWASVAQGANADADETLMHGKPSKSAVAWSESSSNEPDCDGQNHVDTLRLDQVESGFGTLRAGLAWTQVWLFDATHPVGGEAVRAQEFRYLNKRL